MRLSLLRDERREEGAGFSSRMATVASKENTCPVKFAMSTGSIGPQIDPPLCHSDDRNIGQSDKIKGGQLGEGTSLDSWDAYPDDWIEDREVGVAIKDQSGR